MRFEQECSGRPASKVASDSWCNGTWLPPKKTKAETVVKQHGCNQVPQLRGDIVVTFWPTANTLGRRKDSDSMRLQAQPQMWP